ELEPVPRVVRRNSSEDPLVGAAEAEGDVLANEEAAVRVDDDTGDEAVDRELPSRRRGGGERGRRHQGQCQEQGGEPADALSSRRRRAELDALRGGRARSTVA